MTIEVARAALRAPHWLLLALAAVGLAACEGDTMPDGPAGPTGPSGPSGPPPGSGSPQPIASAESLTALITAVNVPEDGRPVIDIYVVDQAGRPVAGLPAGSHKGVRFVVISKDKDFDPLLAYLQAKGFAVPARPDRSPHGHRASVRRAAGRHQSGNRHLGFPRRERSLLRDRRR